MDNVELGFRELMSASNKCDTIFSGGIYIPMSGTALGLVDSFRITVYFHSASFSLTSRKDCCLLE